MHQSVHAMHTSAHKGTAFLFRNPLVFLDKVNLTVQEGPCNALAGLTAARNRIILPPWLPQVAMLGPPAAANLLRSC